MTDISEAAIQAVHEINLTCIPTLDGGQPIEEPWRWDLAEKIIQAALDEETEGIKKELEICRAELRRLHSQEGVFKQALVKISGLVELPVDEMDYPFDRETYIEKAAKAEAVRIATDALIEVNRIGGK